MRCCSMELLVILIGEFLLYPFVAAAAAFGHAFVAICTFLLEILFYFWPSRKRGQKPANRPSQPSPSTKHKGSQKGAGFRHFGLIHWIMGLSVGVLIFGLLSILVVDRFFFSETVRWLATQVEAKTAVNLSFHQVEGSFIGGRFRFDELKARKNESDFQKYDLRANRVEFEIDLFSLLSDTIVIERLTAAGVSGEFWQQPTQRDSDDVPQPARKVQARKEFLIEILRIAPVDLTLHHVGERSIALSLDKIEAEPFRSRYAVFDSFFRANIRGTLDGRTISIASDTVPNGRETSWKFDRVPVDLIKLFAPFAPFTWFKNGDLTVDVQDRWEQGDSSLIDLDWRIQLAGVRLEAPDETNPVNKAMMKPLVAYFENREEPLDYRFQLVMNEHQFLHSASLDAAGLWKAASDRLAQAIAIKTGESKDAVSQKLHQGLESFKDFLDEKRKPDDGISK